MKYKYHPLFCLCLSLLGALASPSIFPSSPISSSSELPDPDAYRYRLEVLRQNLATVTRHNAQPDRTYQLQLNKFALLEVQEVKSSYLTLIPSTSKSIELSDKISYQQNNAASMMSMQTLITGDPQDFKVQEIQFQQDNLDELQMDVEFSVREFLVKQRSLTPAEAQRVIQEYSLPKAATSILPQPRNLQQTSLFQFLPTRVAPPLRERSPWDVDWTCISGAIFDQGNCGSCYAVAAVESLSAFLGIYYYTFNFQLAYQEILSCSRNGMTFGCLGGFLEGAFAYIAQHGVYNAVDYPYSSGSTGRDGQCKELPSRTKYKKFITNHYRINNDCLAVKNQLLIQPVTVGISALPMAFYARGIFNGCTRLDKHDHAVLLIGFKEGKGWKIKNSWGKGWGEEGYAWLADGNTCRVCELAFGFDPSSQGIKQQLRNFNVNSRVPLKTCDLS